MTLETVLEAGAAETVRAMAAVNTARAEAEKIILTWSKRAYGGLFFSKAWLKQK